MKKIVMVILMVGGISVPAWGGENDVNLKYFDDLQEEAQKEFENLSRDLGLGLNLIPLAPAEPLGLTGIDIGIEITLLDIDQTVPHWVYAVNDQEPPSYLAIPKLHVQKGLPMGLDIGGIYAGVPTSNIHLVGAELKWAFNKGSLAIPAVALRGSYTKLLGVEQLNFQTEGVDLSISKGLPFLTPYGGIGGVFIQSEAKNLPPPSDELSLDKENISLFKGFVGLRLSLALFKFTAEVDFAKINSYSLKVSFGV
jgi:hypothetical protein